MITNKEFTLIVGLGNPGENYFHTRHNVGFRVLDKFLSSNDSEDPATPTPSFTMVQKNKSELARIQAAGCDIILAKPQTFMNRSGEAIQNICSYFKIPPEKILVVHDDIDLPFGNVRFSHDSGPAGHNGVKSVIELLGTQQLTRLRIGIGPKEKQPHLPAEHFVLEDFAPAEDELLQTQILPKSAEAILSYLSEGYQNAAARYN